MKIKLDENITATAKQLFAAHGHECQTVPDEELAGAPDTKLVDVYRSEQRMFVTFLRVEWMGDDSRGLTSPTDRHSGAAVTSYRPC